MWASRCENMEFEQEDMELRSILKSESLAV